MKIGGGEPPGEAHSQPLYRPMQCVQELALLRTLCKRRWDVRRLQTVIARMRGACISPLKMACFTPFQMVPQRWLVLQLITSTAFPRKTTVCCIVATFGLPKASAACQGIES